MVPFNVLYNAEEREQIYATDNTVIIGLIEHAVSSVDGKEIEKMLSLNYKETLSS